MPEFVNYQLQQLPIRQIDTNLVGNALATITAGNKEALQTQSALRNAIAKMDLNEAEDGFRQALYDDITKTIEDNAIEGNAYYALDDIIKQGDVLSNPALLGRVKAQQAYKQYQAQVDARTDIDQDIKDWAKELNPYSYQDKFDENGRIIGGSTWTPNFTPESALDMNKIYAIASQYIIPKKGSINGATFIDPITRETSPTYKPGMAILNETTGSYEKVTPEMAIDAINTAINNNPQFAAQMEQSWRVAKWKHDKEPNMPNLAYDGTRELSFDEYKNNLINPFINFHVRNEKIAHTTWHIAAAKTAADKTGKSDEKAVGMVNTIDGSDGNELLNYVGSQRSSPNFSINLPTRFIDQSVKNVFQKGRTPAVILGVPITELPETFDEFLRSARGKPTINIESILNPTYVSNRNIKDGNKLSFIFPNAKTLSTDEFNDVRNFYDMYGSEIGMLKRPQNFTDGQIIDFVESAIKTSSGIDSLDVDDPRIKAYKDKYGTAVNYLFDGDDSVTYNYNGYIDASDKNRLKALNIDVDGNKITLNKNNPDAAYAFVDFVNNHMDGSFEKSNNEIRADKDSMLLERQGTLRTSEFRGDYDDHIFGNPRGYSIRIGRYNNFFKDLNSDKYDVAGKKLDAGVSDDEPTVLLNTEMFNGLSVGDFVSKTVLEMTGEAKVKTMTETAARDILNLAKGNIIDRTIFIAAMDDNGNFTYRKATRDEKLKIHNELGDKTLADVTGNLTYIDGFQYRPGIVYTRENYYEGETDDGDPKYTKIPYKETVNIILGDSITDPMLNELNSADYLQIGTELTENWINNGRVIIGKSGSQPITIRPAKLSDSDNYNGKFNVYMGSDDKPSATIDASTAIAGTIAYRMMINDRASLPLTGDDSNDSELIGQYFAQNPDIYNAMLDLYGDEDSVLQIATYIFTK